MKHTRLKHKQTFYLNDELMSAAREVRERVGITLGRLVNDGLLQQVQKWQNNAAEGTQCTTKNSCHSVS